MFHYVIGRGGFGKVWKVEKKKEKKLYAMKEMHKGRIIQKRSVNSVMNEKKFLSQLNHPYLTFDLLCLVSSLICTMLFKTVRICIW
jgi:serine/threonine protein kinase